MAEETRWYCKEEHREDITDRVRAALDTDDSTVFRYHLPILGKKKRKRLQVRCSQGHLNVIVVD